MPNHAASQASHVLRMRKLRPMHAHDSPSRRAARSGCGVGEPDALVAGVKHGVVGAHEYVAQDPQRPGPAPAGPGP